jgi:UDP-N-acetylmuramoyl-tripeptide--D-alanyl-D-alanine ligase
LRAGAGGVPVLTFGTADAADGCLLAATSDAEGCTVSARILGIGVRFRLVAPGRHMAMNATAALLAAAALGASPVRGAAALEAFTPMAGRGGRRMVCVPGGRVLLLDESYNASGASVRAALAVLALQPARRRLAALGDMLELGQAGPAEHAALAPEVARSADLVFTCGPLSALLQQALPAALRGGHFSDSAALAPALAAALQPGDAVLVKGSLGSRMKHVVEAIDTLGAAPDLGAA